MMSNHLDLGCGTNPQNPYNKPNLFGVDIRDDSQSKSNGKDIVIKKANLVFEGIPFDDNYFSSVSAIDFLEHIPRQVFWESSSETKYPFINLMNEIWRVLSPEGRFIAVTPCYPSALAFADPTHVNYISSGTHEYFCGDQPAARIYGFKGQFTARVAKLSAPSNYRIMPPNKISSTIRDATRILSGKGLSHIVWELEALK